MVFAFFKRTIPVLAVCFICLSTSIAPASDNPFTDLLGGTVVCFPHIATSGGWETEVALINPTTETVSGTLTSYSDQGTQVSQPKAITLAPNARVQYTVSQDFASSTSIAYMVFESGVFGIKGYTKFYKDGNRVSIMASGARMSGIFTKIEKDGGTGMAFVNMEDVTASVVLTAYGDDGSVVAQNNLTVNARQKIVMQVQGLFPGKDLGKATYVTFTSDKGLVGFFLNGSSDGTMLDGSQAL